MPLPDPEGLPNESAPNPRWLLLSVLAPPRGEELLLIDALRRLGAKSVEREAERFVARLPPRREVEALLTEAERAVRASTSLEDPGLEWCWQPHDEWADEWTRGLAPRRVTDRIVVAPTGTAVDARPGDLVIRLNPAAAFGTAEHPTTRMCLEFLDRLVRIGDRVADIGSGSGILAIAAAGLGAASVLALEADPLACLDARANVRLAGSGDRIHIRELEVTAPDLPRLGRFQGVVVNLEWPLLRSLLHGLPSIMARDGWLVVAGLLAPERTPFLTAARSLGLSLRHEAAERGWWAGHLSAPAHR